MGGFHYFRHDGQRDPLVIPDGVALIESGLGDDFTKETSITLGFPFDMLVDLPSVVHTVVIDLPLDTLINGLGKGYLLDLMNFCPECLDCQTPFLVNIQFPWWGTPVTGSRLFLVASKFEWGPLLVSGTPKVMRDILPHVRQMAPNAKPRGNLHPGLYSLWGYLNASDSPAPALSDWGEKYLMCEKGEGKTLRVSRLTSEEVGLLWGYTPKTSSPSELSRVTPTAVLKNFLCALKKTFDNSLETGSIKS